MDGNTEIRPQSLDDLAFRLLLQEIVRTGDPDLCEVTEDLIFVSAGSGERTAKLHSRCAMTVVDAARWLPTVTPQQILERAIAVDVDEDVIDDFCEMHSLSPDGGADDEAESAGDGQPVTEDCANCPACRAYAIISRQLAAGREADLIEAATKLAEWMASPAPGIDPEEAGPQLNSRCVFEVASAMDWLLKASPAERFARAKDVGLEQIELIGLLRRGLV